MKAEVISKKRVFDGFLKMDEVEVRFERFGGGFSPVVRRLCVERGDAAAALIWHKEREEVLLVRQFRYPSHTKGEGWLTELVAGGIKEGEDPTLAMSREIEEETGYTPSSLRHIHTFYTSPGGTSERILLYYAEVTDADKTAEGGGVPQEDEDIETVAFSRETLAEMLRSFALTDAKTIIAVQWFLRHTDPTK